MGAQNLKQIEWGLLREQALCTDAAISYKVKKGTDFACALAKMLKN